MQTNVRRRASRKKQLDMGKTFHEEAMKLRGDAKKSKMKKAHQAFQRVYNIYPLYIYIYVYMYGARYQHDAHACRGLGVSLYLGGHGQFKHHQSRDARAKKAQHRVHYGSV